MPQNSHSNEVSAARKWFDKHRKWAHLYNNSRWKHPVTGLRIAILRRDPVCTECHRVASTVADHVRDHNGDPVLFWDPNNLRGVCKPCHDKKTGSMHGTGDRKPQEFLVGSKVVDPLPE